MDEEAIKGEKANDVSTDIDNLEPVEIEEPSERKLSAREQKMQDVINKRQEQINNNDGEPPVDREFQQVTPKEAIEYDEPEELKPKAKPLPVYQNEAGEYVIKLKVDGNEIERPFDQVLATAQKHESADKRLEAMNQRQQQLEQYENLLRNKEASITAMQNSSSPSKQQDARNDVSEEAMDAFFEQIYDGNTSEAKALLKDMLAGRQQPTLDPNALKQELTQSAVIELENRIKQREYDNSLVEGANWLKTNHPEVLADELLYRTIDAQTTVIKRDDPSLKPSDVIRLATEQVLERMGGNKASSRTENKAQLKPQPVRQANSRYVPPAKEVIDNSPQAVIARQKASRNALARRSV